ncbi:hypothetical protein GSI_07546 [Ganoderma sinense ZZ0214-1]|uniref:Retrotransposon gag domain-containing protein n=1 Tax=Ganoderma sinense ZZ0214-1 TaxID=1077348 RepID=A0A2G8S9C3_9APHY|nr:hypothetical protein GSI_07546 [Ganoderma sinense ZZ0214-1]
MSVPIDTALLEALYAMNRTAAQRSNADFARLSAQSRPRQAPVAQPQAPPATQPTLPFVDYYHPSVELREPVMFNGAADNVEPFLRDVEVHFRLQRAALVTDADRVGFFSMYLGSGTPESWFNAVTRQHPILLADWPSLKADFLRRFQSTNLVAKYTRKLEALWQDGPAADFANLFQEYLTYVEWSEQVKIWEFDRRLRPDLRRLLVNDPRPPTLEEWIPLVVEADNRLRELETELEPTAGSDRDLEHSPSPSRSSTPSQRPESPPPSFPLDDNLDPNSQSSKPPSDFLPLPTPPLPNFHAFRPRTASPPSYRPTFAEFPELPEPSPISEPGPNDPVPMDVDALRARRY